MTALKGVLARASSNVESELGDPISAALAELLLRSTLS
jgi:hypothetical protein